MCAIIHCVVVLAFLDKIKHTAAIIMQSYRGFVVAIVNTDVKVATYRSIIAQKLSRLT